MNYYSRSGSITRIILTSLVGFLAVFFIFVVFINPANATEKKKPPNQTQTQTQTQQQSQWLKNKLEAFNNQVNNGVDYLDCAPAVGYQEIDGASHSVITLSGCIGYEDFNNTGAASVGLVVPFVSKEAKRAFRTKAREAEREADRQASMEQLQNAFRDAVREIRRLNQKVEEMERNNTEK